MGTGRVERRQDKARFLAAGTSFLSFCLHIVFAGLALCAARALQILYSLLSTAPAASPAMDGEGETARLTPMQAFLRLFTTSAIIPCRLRFDFRSSSHGARRRRLPHPSRQGPQSWQCTDKRAADRRGTPTPGQLSRRGPSGHKLAPPFRFYGAGWIMHGHAARFVRSRCGPLPLSYLETQLERDRDVALQEVRPVGDFWHQQ